MPCPGWDKKENPRMSRCKKIFSNRKYEGCYSVVGAAYATITDLDIFLSCTWMR